MKQFIVIFVSVLVVCGCSKPEAVQGDGVSQVVTAQPCPTDPTQTQTLVQTMLTQAQGTFNLVNCGNATGGDCVEYSASKYVVSPTTLETTTTVRTSNEYLDKLTNIQTRTTVNFAASCLNVAKIVLTLSGQEASYMTPLDPGAVVEMNQLESCGLTNWALGVEQFCQNTAAVGKFIAAGSSGANLLISQELTQSPSTATGISFTSAPPGAPAGTQAAANSLFASAQGAYSLASQCLDWDKGHCMSLFSETVTMSAGSVQTNMDHVVCDTLTPAGVVQDCYHTREITTQSVVGVNYFSSGAFELQLGPPSVTVAPLDQATANYYNAKFICKASMRVSVDAPCPVTYNVAPNYVVYSASGGVMSGMWYSSEIIPIGADAAILPMAGPGVELPEITTP